MFLESFEAAKQYRNRFRPVLPVSYNPNGDKNQPKPPNLNCDGTDENYIENDENSEHGEQNDESVNLADQNNEKVILAKIMHFPKLKLMDKMKTLMKNMCWHM